MKHALLVLCIGLVAACAPRGGLDTAARDPNATVRDVYIARFRQDTGQIQNFGQPRDNAIGFEKAQISIPPTHETGQIEWPRGTPDAATDFVVVGQKAYADLDSFVRAVSASDTSGENETVIHVHGYNTTHGEAVYGAAQVGHDMDVPVPTVLFSWPSAAQTKGYLYDRDSVLISRDMLEEVIVAFANVPGRSVFLTAHSMGSHLLMEALRQIAIGKRLDLARDINGVMLLAPDLDTELFREQASRLGDLPRPFLVMVAEQDQALRVSADLTGRGTRLGSLTRPEELDDLDVTLVDVGSLSDGRRFEHNITTSSPSALAIFRQLSKITPPGELHIVDSIVKADQVEGVLPRLLPVQ